MSEFFFVLAILAAFIYSGTLIVDGPTYQLGEEAKKLVDQCEAELPRNKECEIIAVPKDSETE